MEVCDERNELLEKTADCISNIEDGLKCLGMEGDCSTFIWLIQRIQKNHFKEKFDKIEI